MTSDDTIEALRDELQRVRIERAGLVTDLEEAKAELTRLRTENENLRAELEARPKKKRGAKKRQTEAVAPSAAEGEATLNDLTKEPKP